MALSAEVTDESSSTAGLSSFSSKNIKFLGRGTEAIVRPGVVLLSPPDEYHHFLKEAAVFIYAMGHDDNDVYVIRGVIVDQPTPFTLKEMMSSNNTTSTGGNDTNSSDQVASTDGSGASESPLFLQNCIYRGGEWGDSAFMFHSDKKLASEAGQEMIGNSGIYEGGMNHVLANGYDMDPSKVKFFFSYMEFTETELEEMLANRAGKNSTEWMSVEVPPEVVLNSDLDKGEAWARLRNGVHE